MWQRVSGTGLHLPGRVYGLCLDQKKTSSQISQKLRRSLWISTTLLPRPSPSSTWPDFEHYFEFFSFLWWLFSLWLTCRKWEIWIGSWDRVLRKMFVRTRDSLGPTGIPLSLALISLYNPALLYHIRYDAPLPGGSNPTFAFSQQWL